MQASQQGNSSSGTLKTEKIHNCDHSLFEKWVHEKKEQKMGYYLYARISIQIVRAYRP